MWMQESAQRQPRKSEKGFDPGPEGSPNQLCIVRNVLMSPFVRQKQYFTVTSGPMLYLAFGAWTAPYVES